MNERGIQAYPLNRIDTDIHVGEILSTRGLLRRYIDDKVQPIDESDVDLWDRVLSDHIADLRVIIHRNGR